ncbi:MAG: ABC transporter ATP-binding protein [Marinisporobacter sp.]|jgi:ABC-2 type transport system ATP-binding protein|nr:ABC transporter ATP-binding protein [Marinisporobacter sp.]
MIEAINLIKKYGDYTAVNNVNINIKKGELFGLLGPNGAGKSTIVSMISSVLIPDSGEIKIDQKTLKGNEREIKSIIGVVPQELALYETLNTKDNLRFFGSLYGLKGKKLNKRVEEVIDLIGLREKANQPVEEYSGGMKRRVNIGIALMHNPQIIILDEPTVGIDPQSRNHILKTIKRLNKEKGITVIYTSHYMEEVEYLCNRIGIIDYGKLIALGTKEELKNRTDACDVLQITYSNVDEEIVHKIENIQGVEKVAILKQSVKILINPKKRSAIDIVDELKKLGITITSFSYQEVNLETIFLQLTGKTLRD